MSRLRPPSANRSQFLTTQNLPVKSSAISNPISINKVNKQVEIQNSIATSKPVRELKANQNTKSLNQTKISKNIQSGNTFEKKTQIGDIGFQIPDRKVASQTTDILVLIKRRLESLKALQMKNAILETKFYEELYLLECKYNNLYKPLKDLRRKIIIGDYEPNDDDCKINQIGDNGDGLELSKPINSELERERELSKDLLALNISNYAAKKGDFVKGIPEFWLTVLKRVGLTSQMIESHDEPILKYLYEIDIDLQDKKPFSFTIRFYFYPNEYFTNEVLTKNYEFKIELDPNDPYIFEAPETISTRGCKINWKKNKNVTKKSKFLDSNDDRQHSFFNFFDTSDYESLNREQLTFDEEGELAIDFEIGYTFKEKVIPRAILYYIGEIKDDDEDENDDDDDNGDVDEDDEDNDFKFNLEQPRCSGVKNLNKN